MAKIKILPSLLSADFSNVSRDIALVESPVADGLHCDIMDGHFVPNITFGPMIVKAVNSATKLPLYVHLMIEKPERYISHFADAGAHEILVHAETCPHLHRALQQIKDAGVKAGVALNPSTPLCMIEHVFTDLDALLIMTVNPGFGGQEFIETMLPKIRKAREMADNSGIDLDIGVDGGIDINTVGRVVDAGANVLIAGAFVFSGSMPAPEACRALRNIAENAGMAQER